MDEIHLYEEEIVQKIIAAMGGGFGDAGFSSKWHILDELVIYIRDLRSDINNRCAHDSR
jgi:hypothetical protein